MKTIKTLITIVTMFLAIIAIFIGLIPFALSLIWCLLFGTRYIPYILIIGANIMIWGVENLTLKLK